MGASLGYLFLVVASLHTYYHDWICSCVAEGKILARISHLSCMFIIYLHESDSTWPRSTPRQVRHRVPRLSMPESESEFFMPEFEFSLPESKFLHA